MIIHCFFTQNTFFYPARKELDVPGNQAVSYRNMHVLVTAMLSTGLEKNNLSLSSHRITSASLPVT